MPKAADIRNIFDRVVARYDLLNRVLSLGRDISWRKALVRSLQSSGAPVLDLCCGTGDVALDYFRHAGGTGPLVAADFSLPMCRAARSKLAGRAPSDARWSVACADALAMPFPTGSFAAATVAFGVRNFEDLERGLRELRRVIAPGGKLAVLEFAPPRGLFLRALYRPWLRLIVPLAGRLLAGPGPAYGYLSSSIQSFLTPERMCAALSSAGFSNPRSRSLTFGITFLYTAVRPD